MASSVTYSYRDSFTATGGTSFGRRGTRVQQYPIGAPQAGYGSDSEITSAMHFTAPVGTSYEVIYDSNGLTGADEFGEPSQGDFAIFFNRSETDTLTLRFDAAVSINSYVTIPPNGRFIVYAPRVILTAGGDLGTSISAKFTSASGVVEVLAGSLNTYFS